MYTAIVGLVMLAAVLEWFLWLAAFMYCLVKVFQKAEHWTVRILSVIVGTAFLLLRQVSCRVLAGISRSNPVQIHLLAYHDRHTATAQPGRQGLAR